MQKTSLAILSDGVQLLTLDKNREFSDLLPETVQEAHAMPKIFQLIKEAGEDRVIRYVEFELINLAALISVGGNLNTAQVKFLARELVGLFPNESVADFKLCFRNGARGDYGDLFRLDGIIIREWLNKYLEEKYRVLHDEMKAPPEEKSDVPIAPLDVANKYLDELKAKLSKQGPRSVPQLTPEEIKKEGRDKPPPRVLPKKAQPEEVVEFFVRSQYVLYRATHFDSYGNQLSEFLDEPAWRESMKEEFKPLYVKLSNLKKSHGT